MHLTANTGNWVSDAAGDPDEKNLKAALIYTIMRAANESRTTLAVHANVRFVREMLNSSGAGASEEVECAVAFQDALQWIAIAQTRMTAPATASEESSAGPVPSAYRVLQERVKAGDWASVVRLVDCFRLTPLTYGVASSGGSALQEAIECGHAGLALLLMLRAAQNIPFHGPYCIAALRPIYDQLIAAGKGGGWRAGPQERYTLRALEMLRSQVDMPLFPANVTLVQCFSDTELCLRIFGFLYDTCSTATFPGRRDSTRLACAPSTSAVSRQPGLHLRSG